MSDTLSNNVHIFEKMCRICLEQKSILQNIFRLSLNTIISECTTVQISFNDGLPQMVCENCITMAKQALKFKAQCETSDKILRTMINDSFNDISNNESSVDPLYICESELSLGNQITECVEIKVENNFESLENPDNEVFPEVESVIVKMEVAEDANIINKSNINDECKDPLQKRRKKSTRRYNCTICKDYFRNMKDLSKHIDETHGERPFKCDHCPLTFNLEVILKNHMRIHTGHKPFSCSACDKRFYTKGGLESHSWQHRSEEERPFLCSLCGKKATSERRLALHMETHQESRNYQCELCSKTYSTSKSLKDHLRIHTGVRRVVCPVCGKQLSSSNSLKNHMRSHNKETEMEKPFSCTQCSKKFFTKDILKKHVVIHSGEKKHICSVCKRAFTHKSTLKTHMWIHKGGYPFQCDVCGQRFLRNTFLLEHKKKRHQEISFALDDNK